MPARILFIGSQGIQSLVTLKCLLESGHEVCTVAVAASVVGLADARARYLPLVGETLSASILTVAAEHGIPVEVLDANSTGDRLERYASNVGIVSCYPHRLSESLLQLPRYGCFNLHPSLLPKYRGSAPLFWQFKNGELETGVTLHQMSEHIDAGAIVAQKRLRMGDGVTGPALSELCAKEGVTLILSVLSHLEQGTLSLTAQDELKASYHGWPQAQEFMVATDWSARRIYNFMCGTRHWGRHYILRIGRARFMLELAEEYSLGPSSNKTYVIDNNRIKFACHDGSVTALLAD